MVIKIIGWGEDDKMEKLRDAKDLFISVLNSTEKKGATDRMSKMFMMSETYSRTEIDTKTLSAISIVNTMLVRNSVAIQIGWPSEYILELSVHSMRWQIGLILFI
jgi:hypothetical protein